MAFSRFVQFWSRVHPRILLVLRATEFGCAYPLQPTIKFNNTEGGSRLLDRNQGRECKTAKALGLKISESFLQRADVVIE